MRHFEARLAAALEKAKPELKKRPAIYLAAVSGGADSAAMLAALAALRGEMGFALHCVHVEHGIRPAEESRGDAMAVKTLCERFNVPCRVISIPPGSVAAYAGKGGSGIEAAARFFRHRALRRERRRVKAGWILTAHTRDDLLETILMRVLRGSGPAGLAPMPAVRGRLLRPILELTRHDVLEYLADKNIPYRTDSTNEDTMFLRNRIRLKLIPVLDNFFPSWRSSVLAMAETQGLTAEFLASEVRKHLPWEEENAKQGSSFRLRETDFLAAHPVLREEAVFTGADMLAAGSGPEGCVPRRTAVRRAVAQGDAGDLGPVRLEKRKGWIYLTPKQRRGERDFSLLIKETGKYNLKAGLSGRGKPALCVRVSSADCGENIGFSAKFPLVFRNHRTGDLILKEGRKRRLSDILDIVPFSGYTGIITAFDEAGLAAFIVIGGDLLVISRDNEEFPRKPDTGNSFFHVSLEKAFFEGMDV